MTTELSPESAAVAVSRLSLMAFFPGDPDTRAALIWALLQFVETEEQLEWLTARALKLFSRWPGMAEIRALYCSRFRPKDGAEVYSEVFPNGVPSERTERNREVDAGLNKARPDRNIEDQKPITADHDFQREIERVAASKKFPGVAGNPRGPKRVK